MRTVLSHVAKHLPIHLAIILGIVATAQPADGQDDSSLPITQRPGQSAFRNIYTPGEFLANPSINVAALEGPPKFDFLEFPRYQSFKERLKNEHGLEYVFLNTPLFQIGEGGNHYIDNELDFGGIWNLYDDGGSKGNLLWFMLWVQTFSPQPTGAYAGDYGLITFPNSAATDPNFGLVQLNVLAWEQTWADERVSLRIGQLRSDFFFGFNKYHNDDRYIFMHTILSGLQGINWGATSKGLGAMVDLRSDFGYMSFGLADAKADQRYPDFESFVDGRYHYLAEFGWTPTFGCNSQGEYKVTLNYTARTGDPSDVGEREGYGLILSARQDINERVGLSARWNKSFERFKSSLRDSLATGITFTGVGSWKDDWIGIGYFYGNPIDRTLDEEHGLEIYWRAQMTKTIEVTPDFQYYFQRAKQPGTAVFGGIRIRFMF